MNVLIVYPNLPNAMDNYLKLPSLDICQISSILKGKGIFVDLFDMRINSYKVEDYLELNTNKYDYIYFEDTAETHFLTKIMISKTQKINNSPRIVIHSEMSTLRPELIIERNENLDFIVRYDDDYALLNIINSDNNPIKLSKVYNIVYRNQGKFIYNTIKRNYYDINNLPVLDRGIYELHKYVERDRETIVRSSRGCLGNCSFCVKTKVETYRQYSMSRFCDEIKYLQEIGFKSFFFADDMFAYSIDRLIKFKDELYKRNMNVVWTSNLRIVDVTDDLIALMKKLGAYRVFVGIETINSNSSNLVDKNITKDMIINKINIIKKYNIEIHASFIVGCPNDRIEDLEATIEFVKEINPDLVTFNTLKVYPGIDLYDQNEKFDIILQDPYWYEKEDWTANVINGTKMLPPDIIQKYAKKMLGGYFING